VQQPHQNSSLVNHPPKHTVCALANFTTFGPRGATMTVPCGLVHEKASIGHHVGQVEQHQLSVGHDCATGTCPCECTDMLATCTHNQCGCGCVCYTLSPADIHNPNTLKIVKYGNGQASTSRLSWLSDCLPAGTGLYGTTAPVLPCNMYDICVNNVCYITRLVVIAQWSFMHTTADANIAHLAFVACKH